MQQAHLVVVGFLVVVVGGGGGGVGHQAQILPGLGDLHGVVDFALVGQFAGIADVGVLFLTQLAYAGCEAEARHLGERQVSTLKEKHRFHKVGLKVHAR